MSAQPRVEPSRIPQSQDTERVRSFGGNRSIRAFVNSIGPIHTGHWFLNTHPRRGAAMG
ncbi:hypothetical protein Caci_1676 [Catenulispora acidiphila DSM 44928]|uniref:Uncharacterized protein n=1 Tax=Catenulispora acidiphila (strain DSM 44928 / JCM 14897 / NBRC 102108 / NRRL B-24433 / ID139908) TaxID=479433 RepID=C7QBM0_CATAD|nr:hypothetical protein Caci_1676 [Catenulispora acidiphila DSM 44928]